MSCTWPPPPIQSCNRAASAIVRALRLLPTGAPLHLPTRAHCPPAVPFDQHASTQRPPFPATLTSVPHPTTPAVERHRVGSGGLGIVYPAIHAPSGLEVALKLGSCFAPDQREQ